MSAPILEAQSLSYGTPSGRLLASALSFALRPGEILAVEGPNGSGKSTLLRVLLGMAPPSSGSVAVHVPRDRIAYLPQLQNTSFHLPVSLTDVLEITLGRALAEAEALRWNLLSADQLTLAWETASGGERKRTLLTGALMGEPRLLVLDEPLNHLDDSSREAIVGAIAAFLASPGERAIVLVSHQPEWLNEAVGERIRRVRLGGEAAC